MNKAENTDSVDLTAAHRQAVLSAPAYKLARVVEIASQPVIMAFPLLVLAAMPAGVAGYDTLATVMAVGSLVQLAVGVGMKGATVGPCERYEKAQKEKFAP